MRQLKISKSITNRESAALEKYLQEIARKPMVSADEEAELARRIHKGDDAALDTLVNANLRFVVSVAKQYQSQGLSLLDLIDEGNLGLIKAAQKFDETKGFKFVPACGSGERESRFDGGHIVGKYGLNGSDWRTIRDRWRLNTALLAMSHPRARTESVATAVGYGSPNALCHAFREANIPSPGSIRDALARLA